MPIVLQVDRGEVVADVLDQLVAEPKNFMLKFDQPWTVGILRAFLDGNEYMGMGCAKVCHPDTWSEEKGRSLVLIRAARQIADEFITELERAEQQANDMASDIGMLVLEHLADENGAITKGDYEEFVDTINSIIDSHEEEE